MKELVSIIIPVYNVENYLDRCINSVLNQTYKNIEIILIDDGSTDKCPQKCDDYAKMDVRVRVFHKMNGGLSDARNYGITFANGKYLTFIDSDDFVDKKYIQYLLDNLKQADADISMCSFQKFRTTSELEMQDEEKEENKLLTISGMKALEQFCYHSISHEAWAKLYKTELFQNINFPVGKIYEDYGTIYKLFYMSKKIVIGKKRYYYYFQRNNSIMSNTFSSKSMDRADLTEEFLEFIKIKCPMLVSASYTRALVSYSILLRDCPNNIDNKQMRTQIVKKVKEYSKNVIKTGTKKKSILCMAILSNFSVTLLQILLRIIKGL